MVPVSLFVFVHCDLIIDFLLLVTDGHLALSYGRFSHTVSRISFY